MKASGTGQAVEQTSSRSSQETGRENPANPKRRRFLVVLAVTAAFAAAAAGMVAALAAPSSAVLSDAAPAAEAEGSQELDKGALGSELAEHLAEGLASRVVFLETSMDPPLEEEIGVLAEDLESVLSPLVDDGTIDQAQLDAVIAAVVASVREKHQAMVDCFSELQALDDEALTALKEGNSEPPEECAEIFAEYEDFGMELSEDKADYLSQH